MAVVVDTLLAMLDKDVVDSSKACAEYFDFFKNYATSVSACTPMQANIHVVQCSACNAMQAYV